MTTGPAAPIANLFATLGAAQQAPQAPQPAQQDLVQMPDGRVITRAQAIAETTPPQAQQPAPQMFGVAQFQQPAAPQQIVTSPIPAVAQASAKRGRGRPKRGDSVELIHKCASAGLTADEATKYLALLDTLEGE